ncbi:MAG TPA: MOSC domain-containing protein [Nitrospinaceae bacterium]|jgi:MOSC domain-containing protein YiiM|nr:MOSC domain-containing protein [Nitrospinaceae bacterium]
MKVLSINVGSLREMLRKGKIIQTGIFKQSMEVPIEVKRLGLEGDQQANNKLHGGIYKAICVYPSEYYDLWKEELGKPNLSFGDFGENLTTIGLLEDDIYLGDRLRIGTVEVVVTQPREPCITLDARLGTKDLSARIRKSGRSGFYFSVEKEGVIKNGDSIENISQDKNKVSISDFNQVINRKPEIDDIIERASKIDGLPPKLKKQFLKI